MIRRYAFAAVLFAALSACAGGSRAVPVSPAAPSGGAKLQLSVPPPPRSLAVPPRAAVVRTTPAAPARSGRRSPSAANHPAFFDGEVALSNGVFYLQFPNGNVFGYYSYLPDPHYIYHFDLGYEYVSDPGDGHGGVYLYDFAGGDWWYTSPAFSFPYVFDFTLNAFVYYYPDPKNAGHYTANPRYFYDFSHGQIITEPGTNPNPTALFFAGGATQAQLLVAYDVNTPVSVDASGCTGIAAITYLGYSAYHVTASAPGTCSLIVSDSAGLRSAVPVFVAGGTTGSVTEYPLAPAAQPSFIVTGPDGNFWFTEFGSNAVARMTTGGAVTEFPLGRSHASPAGITVGPDANIWFAETLGAQIGRLTPAGTLTEFPVPASTAPGSWVPEPSRIVAGPDGALWFTETAGPIGGIGRITTTGTIAQYMLPAPNAGVVAIASGPDGNLWFTEYAAMKIGRITTAGAITEFATTAAPYAIVAGPDGALWFTEPAVRRIGRITTTGAIRDFPLPGGAPSVGLWDIVTGPDGNLWFTASNGKIGRMTPSGSAVLFSLPSATADPVGITIGPDHALWFAEEGANNIGRIQP